MTFGEFIKNMRSERHWTQGDLATNAKVSVRTVVRLEKTEAPVKVRPAVIIRLATALNVPGKELLALAGITLPEDDLKAFAAEDAFAGGPLAHGYRRQPKELLEEVALKMAGRPALLCVSVTSDRSIANADTNDVMRRLLQAGLRIAITSPYPSGSYVSAYRSRVPNITRFYNSVFGRVCGMAKQLKETFKDYKDQIVVMRLSAQPVEGKSGPLRLAAPSIGITDNRPCLFFFPGAGKNEPDGGIGSDEYILAAYIRFGGNRPDQWVVSYPIDGDLEERERAEDTKDNWVDYFFDIIESWKAAQLSQEAWQLPDASDASWNMYTSEGQSKADN